MKQQKIIALFYLIVIMLPSFVLGKCPCEPEKENGDKKHTLKYKIAAIASILVAGAIGICIPILGRKIPALSPEKNIFFLIKAFAAGVILSTGFIHVLPDAFDKLQNPCYPTMPWKEFPFTGFVAMVAAIGTLMVDTFATSFFNNSHFSNNNKTEIEDNEKQSDEHLGHVHVHTHATHGHAHGASVTENPPSSEILRHRVISNVLELGIVVHSVIIGIALGVDEDESKIKALVVALSFHQFFEGMGLGGCISQAKFKSLSVAIMSIFFSLTTPVGIAIGIVISKHYNETSSKALIVQGIFNAASAGILIYMSLVDLLAADFMNPKIQSNIRLQLGANASLLFGAGCMSVLAEWA